MDALSLILRTIRETIESTGAPPDALQSSLEESERLLRSRMGGSMHHISRLPQISTKRRVIELADQGLSSAQISQRLGITDRHARRVVRMLRVDIDD